MVGWGEKKLSSGPLPKIGVDGANNEDIRH